MSRDPSAQLVFNNLLLSFTYYLLYWPEEDPPGSKRRQIDNDDVFAAEDFFLFARIIHNRPEQSLAGETVV